MTPLALDFYLGILVGCVLAAFLLILAIRVQKRDESAARHEAYKRGQAHGYGQGYLHGQTERDAA